MVEPVCAAFLGESAGFWIQTGAIFLSAIAALGVIIHNGLMSRRRATVDHIIHQKTDRELLDAIQLVYKMHDDNEVFSKYHDQKETPEYKAILLVLNNHEFIALGIRRRAFAETIYKELQCSNFLKVWNSSAGIVEELRKSSGRETLFQEFEWLAKRWKENPLKKH